MNRSNSTVDTQVLAKDDGADANGQVGETATVAASVADQREGVVVGTCGMVRVERLVADRSGGRGRRMRSIRLDPRVDAALLALAHHWGIDANAAVSVAIMEAHRRTGLEP
jgi:hypothetical protein